VGDKCVRIMSCHVFGYNVSHDAKYVGV